MLETNEYGRRWRDNVPRARLDYRRLRLITAPAGALVSIAEAKTRLRWEESGNEEQVEAQIEAATAFLDGRDGILGRALLSQTWEYVLDCFPPESRIYLPLPPVQSVTSVTYRDGNGNLQTFPGTAYALGADKNWEAFIALTGSNSWPGTWNDPDAVIIRTVNGYGLEAANVPMPIRQAVLELLEEDCADAPSGCEDKAMRWASPFVVHAF